MKMNIKLIHLLVFLLDLLKNKVVHWDDIPYAQPPVGDLRWRAPRKLDISNKKI